jgi:hypothetical protein
MPKPRLFICGDSFVDWDIPTYHWTDYLEEHYDVIRLAIRGCDNIGIILQVGNIPEYKDGDRIIIYWSDPSRIQNLYRGKTKPKKKGRWWYYGDLLEKDRIPTLEKIKVDRAVGWEKNGLGDEVKFMKKLKELLINYSPIFVTWNTLFHKQSAEFSELIQVSTLDDENESNGETKGDWHPGTKGCYDIYKILLNRLGDETPHPPKTDLL